MFLYKVQYNFYKPLHLSDNRERHKNRYIEEATHLDLQTYTHDIAATLFLEVATKSKQIISLRSIFKKAMTCNY